MSLVVPSHLAALVACRVLNTAPEPEYDRLVRLAAKACGTPAAAISLIDIDRCWFKASVGLPVRQIALKGNFCGYAYVSSGIFVVPDAWRDQRFSVSSLVLGRLGARFYAGAPLMLPEGVSLGTLCVLDFEPRELTQEQLATLRQLAAEAAALLSARRTTPPRGR